ncbi:MAG: hypothetical protein ACK559_11355, partial [bacterium]
GQAGRLEHQRLPAPTQKLPGLAQTPSPPTVVPEAGVEADRQGAVVFRGQRQVHAFRLILAACRRVPPPGPRRAGGSRQQQLIPAHTVETGSGRGSDQPVGSGGGFRPSWGV